MTPGDPLAIALSLLLFAGTAFGLLWCFEIGPHRARRRLCTALKLESLNGGGFVRNRGVRHGRWVELRLEEKADGWDDGPAHDTTTALVVFASSGGVSNERRLDQALEIEGPRALHGFVREHARLGRSDGRLMLSWRGIETSTIVVERAFDILNGLLDVGASAAR